MNSHIYNIPTFSLFLLSFLLIIPIYFLYYLKLKKQIRILLISAVRMIVQLILLGFYLKYLFIINHPLINFLWLLVIIIIANVTILQRNDFKVRLFLVKTIWAYLLTMTFLLSIFGVVLSFQRVINAWYIIPLGGMLLGNMMNTNTIGFDRFYRELSKRQHEYIHLILLGASRQEATKPFLRDAYKSAISPQLNHLATVGIVSLPGILTGQILGGALPNSAIRYQMMIMLALFLSGTVSNFLALNFSIQASFDKTGQLKDFYHHSHTAKNMRKQNE